MIPQAGTLPNTNFEFPNQVSVYHGKVRDVYVLDDVFVSIVTDRISAFDHILPRAIPFKGQVLNQMAAFFLEATKDIVPNWFITSPDPNVSVGKIADPIRIEVVVRGYLTGHSWRTYNTGLRVLCGVALPDGMQKHEQFAEPIITPTIKAMEGHDEDISEDTLLQEKHITAEDWNTIKTYAFDLFSAGQRMASERGLILVDTKYEFGYDEGNIILIDEIHTPDSSRYFFKEDYDIAIQQRIEPKQLSKEFVREWLMSQGFSGLVGQKMPDMNDEIVNEISNKYIALFELVTGQSFERGDTFDYKDRILQNLLPYFAKTQ